MIWVTPQFPECCPGNYSDWKLSVKYWLDRQALLQPLLITDWLLDNDKTGCSSARLYRSQWEMLLDLKHGDRQSLETFSFYCLSLCQVFRRGKKAICTLTIRNGWWWWWSWFSPLIRPGSGQEAAGCKKSMMKTSLLTAGLTDWL